MIGHVLAQRYELLGLLADTPVFANYSAKDQQTKRDVTIRLVQAPFRTQISFCMALAHAVKVQQAVNSPQVETITAIGQDSDVTFLVSDLTRSPTIADRIKKLAPFSIAVAVSTGITICRAVDAVHRADVVHGDLNPQNILMLGDGETKLQLAGIWEAYAASPTAGMSVLPAMAPYLAPEITKGGMPSRQSDIYAVGVVLYELLTGRKPYTGDSALAIAAEHVSTPTPSVKDFNPAVPTVLDEIIKMAMAKDPADRYESITDLMSHLRILQDSLRFGKSLAWPLSTTSAVRDTPKTAAGPAKNQPVAPRMSALRSDEDAEESRRRAREDRDIPLWMTVIASILSLGLIAVIGAFIMMNLSKPKLVTVPNIRDMSVEEARTELKRIKVDLKVSRREANEKVEQDHILEMEPPAGEKVREGERVRVVVSSGSKLVTVPDLHGQTVDKAKQVLGVLNIEPLLQVVNGVEARSDSVVLRTDPPARSQINRFGRIILIVGDQQMLQGGEPDQKPTDQNQKAPDQKTSGDPPKAQKPDPDEATNQYSTSIKVAGTDADINVTVDVTDEDGTRTIFNEARKPGERFTVRTRSKYPKVTFQIFFDGELVKTETNEAKR